MFVACGGDSSSSSGDKGAEISDYDSLPSCTTKNDAERATVDGDEIIYVCKDKNWEVLDVNFVANDTAKTLSDIPNCADEQEGNSYYIEKTGVNYICQDERWEIAVVKKDDSKSSASAPKSSTSTAKSSGSTSKSSASTAKSSASTAKSSGSTSKSSSSTAKSSASKDSGKSSAVLGNVAGDKNKLPNCDDVENVGEVYFVESESAYFVCEDRRWHKTASCGSVTIDADLQFCVDGKIYGLCGGKDYDPSSEKCVNDLVREIKKGFDTLYVETEKLSYRERSVYYYTDGEFAYVEEVEDYVSENGCGSNSSTAVYKEAAYSSYETVDQAKKDQCSYGGLPGCEIKTSLYFFSIKDGTHESMNTCSAPVRGVYRVDNAWKAKFNSEFTYDDFVKTYAPSSCNGTTYHIQEAICYNDKILDLCYGLSYNPDKEFCHDGEYGGGSVVPLCKGEKYDANELFCYNDELMKACGGDPYNPETEFCFYNEEYDYYDLYPLCDGKEYDAANLFCYEDKVYKYDDYCLDYDEDEYNNKYPTSDYICVEYDWNGSDAGAYPRTEYGECARNLVYKIGEEECVGGKVVKAETKPTCGSETYDPATQFCFEGAAYASEEYLACKNSSGEVVSVAGEFQFCFDGKAYDNATYDVCKNSDDEETAVYNKSTQFCFNGEAYASDSYAQCNNEIVEKLETGVCLSDGSYMAMPEELYIANDLVKMKTYSVSGLVRTWTGSGLTTSENESLYRAKLISRGYEESSVAGTYVMADGAFEYSITLEVGTMKNGITTVKVSAAQTPKKIIKG